MQQKVDAAHRPCISIEETGGGLVITFSAGTFEAVKGALLRHFERRIQQGSVVVTKKVDGNGSNVDLSIKVMSEQPNELNTHLEPTFTSSVAYVINLYNSTSRALVNGKHLHLIKDVIKKIAYSLNFEIVNDITSSF